MICEYKQVKIAVIVERREDIQKYFNLFKLLLDGKVLMCRRMNDYAEIDSDKFQVRFTWKTTQVRGWKAHYLLNLTQDKEYHNDFAEPMTVIHRMLDKTVWKELFE